MKTFLVKFTLSDIGYLILIYKNTKEVWEEELQIKASSRTNEERHHVMHHKKPQKRLKRFSDDWTDNRQEYYQDLLRIFKELKSSYVLKPLTRSLEIVSEETLCQR
jgi:hypothetical protein